MQIQSSSLFASQYSIDQVSQDSFQKTIASLFDGSRIQLYKTESALAGKIISHMSGKGIKIEKLQNRMYIYLSIVGAESSF